MGSEYKKPDATTEITRENYKEILWPLPVSELFFCGESTAQKLTEIGIPTIGALAQADPDVLFKAIGRQGPQLRKYARGEDESPVRLYEDRDEAKSVGNGSTFSYDLTKDDDILSAITKLSDSVARRLRKDGLKAYGIKVDIKDISLRVTSHQKQLDVATSHAETIRDEAFEIVKKVWPEGKPIRMLTVTGINLVSADEGEQMTLFAADPEENKKADSVDRAMDEIIEKFGKDAIKFGSKE